MIDPHVRLMRKDEHGHKQQIFPETDVNSIIGFGDEKGDLIDRIEKLEKEVKKLEEHLLYH